MLLLAGLAVAVSLSGCGSESDPYVGTWQSHGSGNNDAVLVIRVESGDYVRYLLADQNSEVALPIPFVEEDGVLRAAGAGSNGGDIVITPGPENERLMLSDDGAERVDLERVSAETKVPSGV